MTAEVILESCDNALSESARILVDLRKPVLRAQGTASQLPLQAKRQKWDRQQETGAKMNGPSHFARGFPRCSVLGTPILLPSSLRSCTSYAWVWVYPARDWRLQRSEATGFAPYRVF